MGGNGNEKEEHRHIVLHILMINCADFKEENPAMEILCKDIPSKSLKNQTISLLVSLKVPYEFVGEGIEFAWGLSKIFFQRK